jgi:phosphate transport system protein
MQSHLQEELEQLKLKTLNMAADTEQIIRKSIQAYEKRDEFLAEQVIDSDAAINKQEVEIDELCLRLLALEGPVASDLRFILGSTRISVDLERIADEAVNMAERSMLLSARPAIPFKEEVVVMAGKALAMFKEAVRAYASGDAELALSVCKMDSEVDMLNHKNVRDIIEHMIRETPAIERSVHTIILIRRIERIADLATNIAESVVFMVRGVNIKHQSFFDTRQ